MPAKSKDQQQLMGMALHNPEKVYKKNRGVLKMSKAQLRDYAETKTGNLPKKTRRKKSTSKAKPIMPKRNR